MGKDNSPYTELAEFIAQMNPEKLLAFKVPARIGRRVTALLNKQQTADLTAEEKHEMEGYLAMERIVSLAKARARLLLIHEPALGSY